MRVWLLLAAVALAALAGCSVTDVATVDDAGATEIAAADDRQEADPGSGFVETVWPLALAGVTGLIVGVLLGSAVQTSRPHDEPAPRPPPRGPARDPALARRVDQLTSQRRRLVDALIDSNDRADSAAVAQTITRALADVGVHAIAPSPGSPFDPTRHIATRGVQTTEHRMTDTIAAVETPGYEDDGSVLRHARVQVNQYQEPHP